MQKEKINKLLAERQELKHQRQELTHRIDVLDSELARIVLNYEGTLIEALRDGIIRLNFKAPANFYTKIRNYK